MELNKDLISQIANVYGITAEDLTAKIVSEEPQTLTAGQLFTDDQLKARDSSKYNEGKEAREEMLIKEAKKEHGYEFEGKSFSQFLTHHNDTLKGKYSKGNNEKVDELESDIKKQRLVFEQEIETLKGANNDLLGQYKKQAAKNKLLSIMPKETTLKKDAIITLFNSEFELDIDNGKAVVMQNGEVLKDLKTTNPLELEGVFNDWLVKENYIKANPGRGGDNEFGNGGLNNVKSIGEFQKQWQKQNPETSFNDPKYTQAYAKWRSENKEVTA